VDLLALAFDLIVPPLALLSMLTIGHAFASLIALSLGSSLVPLFISSAALAAVAASIFGAWFKWARHDMPLRFLLGVPLYVLWKIPLYLSFFAKRRQKTWERTDRGRS